MKQPASGGGWQAIRYTMRKGRQVGMLRLWRAMRAKNACKTCALGMGGQKGGMVNERGHFPEFCKKSLQAMTADMQGRIESRFWSEFSIGQLKSFSPREMEHCGRIVEPVIAEPGDTHYRPITWDEALDRIAGKMRATDPKRAFFYVSGRSSNEAGFLLHVFARTYGTNHVSNCSYYCHQASGVGLYDSIGTGTATVSLDDLEQADLVFLIGGNPASNHPRLMSSLMHVRNRGGHVIVVNPVREVGLVKFKVPSNVKSMLFGSEIASEFAQVKIGGDIAFLTGVAKAVLAQSTVDSAYLDAHCDNVADFLAYLNFVTWDEIEKASGVDREQIARIARLYGQSKRAIFSWTMGITHHEHGVENVQWIVNLALMRGMIGRPGAGMMPIRGHSNVQGIGSIGVYPRLAKAVVEKLTAKGFSVPDWAGYDTIASLEAALRREFDIAFCLGGNLYGATPDASFASQALAEVDTVVYLSTTLNTGHAHGGKTTIILPVQARDEESQTTTQESMFNYVRLSEGGEARLEGPRAETDILADIAGRVGAGALQWEDLKSHERIRGLIAEVMPNLEPLTEIGKDRKEFHIAGRLMHEPKFRTANGRAALHPHPIPTLPVLKPNQLRLMTVRSEGQFNTVVYEEEDIYRGQDRRDVILVNPADLTAMGFVADQTVDVQSEAGIMRGILIRPFDIARGCALMYYPEANVLVPKTVDARSKTPAFKNVVVSIRASDASAAIKLQNSPARRGDLKAC